METIKLTRPNKEVFEAELQDITVSHVDSALLIIQQCNEGFQEEYSRALADTDSVSKYIDPMTTPLTVTDANKQEVINHIAVTARETIVRKHKIIRAVRFSKLLINIDQLSEDDRALIESDDNSSFWRSQPLPELHKAVLYYRENTIH